MTLCKLCKKAVADQTGSHIFTYSFIKSAINEVGQTKRNKELFFAKSSVKSVSRTILIHLLERAFDPS